MLLNFQFLVLGLLDMLSIDSEAVYLKGTNFRGQKFSRLRGPKTANFAGINFHFLRRSGQFAELIFAFG